MAIEIVDFPIKNVIFHSYVSLPEGMWTLPTLRPSFSWENPWLFRALSAETVPVRLLGRVQAAVASVDTFGNVNFVDEDLVISILMTLIIIIYIIDMMIIVDDYCHIYI